MWSTTWRRRRERSANAAPGPGASPGPAAGDRLALRPDSNVGSKLALPIVTRRLVLRDFVVDDLEAVLAYASDPEVTRLMFYGPRDAAETRAYLQRMLESQVERPRLTWEVAVVERDGGRLIGSCDLTLKNEREGDLGYVFGRSSWGQGLATEAACAMVRAGFEQLRLERIFAMCDRSHGASRRVLEKAGLRSQGVVERARQAKGRWWDMWLYELWRDEWARADSGRAKE